MFIALSPSESHTSHARFLLWRSNMFIALSPSESHTSHARFLLRRSNMFIALSGFARKVVLIGTEALAPEEQYVYSSQIPDVSRSVRSGM